MKHLDDLPVQRANINLYEGDLDRLQELYPTIGASGIIRRLVRQHLEKVEAAGHAAVKDKVKELQL